MLDLFIWIFAFGFFQLSQEEIENGNMMTNDTQDYASPKAAENMADACDQTRVIPESTDVSMEDAKSDDNAGGMDMRDQERTSPNISLSSDLLSGTPQKPNSRRQSFITLEKYAEGKPASPSSAATFTGPLLKMSNSQERSNASKMPSSQASQTSISPNTQDLQSTQTGKLNSQHPGNNAPESPRRPKDSVMKSEPVRLIERLHSDTTEDEDVIPDTQTEVERETSTKMSSTSEEINPSSQEEESDQTLDDSQSESPQGEPRRSGRHRVRPLLPGEDPEERQDKYTPFKRRRSGSEPKSESPAQSRPNTRGKQAAEEGSGRDRLRTRAQRDKSESSQTNSEGRAHKKTKLYSSSGDFLDKPQSKRRSTPKNESSQTDLLSNSQSSNNESQSQGRRSRHGKTSVEIKEEGRLKKKILPEKEESRKTCSNEIEKNELEKRDSQMTSPSPQTDRKSQKVELVEQTEKDDQLNKDSETLTSLPMDDTSPESEETTKNVSDAQLVAPFPTSEESRDRTSSTNKLENEEMVKDKRKTKVLNDGLSQEDSQVTTPPSSDSQSLRRSRRSKAPSETGESEDKSDSKDSLGRHSRSNSQTAVPALGDAEAKTTGRTRRSKVHEELSKLSPGSTTQGSPSQDAAGSQSSQGAGRYSRRRSLVTNVETSESESSEPRENSPMPRKRGRKHRMCLNMSPLTLESKEKMNIDLAKDGSDSSERADTQDFEAKNTDLDDLHKSQCLEGSQSLQTAGDLEEQSNEESPMEVEVDAVVTFVPLAPEKKEPDDTNERIDCETNADGASSREDADNGVQLESVERTELIQDTGALVSSVRSEKHQISAPSEVEAEDVSKTGEHVEVGENREDDSDHQERAAVPVEDAAQGGQCTSLVQSQPPNVPDNLTKDDELSASTQHTEDNAEGDIAPLQEKDAVPHTLECQEEEAKTDDVEKKMVAHLASVSAESTHQDVFQDSPAKQKDLEALAGPDVGQSPVGDRTRGTWSPSASPSTSILKKGQKRPLEEECLSPLVKVSDCSLGPHAAVFIQ